MKRIAVIALTLLLPTIAAAHDFWIEPSSFRPAAGSNVTVSLRVGEKLQGEGLPRIPPLIQRFVLSTGKAVVAVPGTAGADPAGSVRITERGTQWLGYQSHPSPVTLEARKFEAYLREEGLESIVSRRTKSGKSTAPGRERFSRCAKALLDVPGARASTTFNAPLGLTLELVPGKNPYQLQSGAELPVTLLFRGKPLPNVLVVARSKTTPEKTVQARTDARGRVTLRLSQPGFWLLKAVHMDAAPQASGVDWESWWASLTFDLRK